MGPIPDAMSVFSSNQQRTYFTVQEAVQHCYYQALQRDRVSEWPSACSAHSTSHTYLEGTNTQLKQDLVGGGDANGESGKHHVVDAEQWD